MQDKDLIDIKVNLATLTERVDQGFQFVNSQINEIKNNHLAHVAVDVKELQKDITSISSKQSNSDGEVKIIGMKTAMIISVATSVAVILLQIGASLVFKK